LGFVERQSFATFPPFASGRRPTSIGTGGAYRSLEAPIPPPFGESTPAGVGPDAQEPIPMERTQLSAVVLELLEKETGETYPAVEESTTLREGLNLDSLDMAGLVLHIESHFGIQIESELLDGIQSVGDLLNVLETKIAAKSVRKAA